jgi:hypothetical protein
LRTEKVCVVSFPRCSDCALRRRRVPRRERRIPAEEFSEPGGSFKLDQGYRNGAGVFLHAVAIGRDAVQAKCSPILRGAFVRASTHSEFTAITRSNLRPTTAGMASSRLFEDNRVSVVPLNRIEKFAQELRQRLP